MRDGVDGEAGPETKLMPILRKYVDSEVWINMEL